MTGALSVLREHAATLAKQGRHGDTELVHVSPRELQTLHALHPRGQLPINPVTGLPEAFDLGGILGAVGGSLLPALFPGIGESLGGLLGIGSDFGGALGGALLGGGLGALGSSLGGGKNPLLYGGLGALGGGLAGYFGPEIGSLLGVGPEGLFGGTGSAAAAAGAGGLSASTEGVLDSIRNGSYVPQAAGAAANAAGSSGSWLSRNWPLMAGGLLLAGTMGGRGGSTASTPKLTQAQKDQQAANAAPAANYTFSRAPVPQIMNPTSWYTLGNQTSGQPILFFDRPGGTYTKQEGPIPGLAGGGQVHGGLGALRASRYVSGPDSGQADTVPARLSDGEYVIDAATVSDLGDGNNEAGARQLDALRHRVARHKGRRQVVPPPARPVERYLGGRG